MTENERRILVEWMETINKYLHLTNPMGFTGTVTLREWFNDLDRIKQLTAQLRDADKPAGGEG